MKGSFLLLTVIRYKLLRLSVRNFIKFIVMKMPLKFVLPFTIFMTITSCSSSKKIVTDKYPTKEIVTDTLVKVEEVFEHIAPTIDTLKIENKPVIENFDHSVFNDLLQTNISSEGETNYKGFIKNRTSFKSYLTALSENMPQDNWTKEDKLAYWMNVYNAFTIKLIIDNYPTKSIKDIKNAWDTRFFKLGKKWYNLSDIEHKILRKMNDPRIHFGINCASFSCPPLLNKAFTAANVNTELEFLAHQFINDKSRNTISEHSIQLSKIFQWYAKDFKSEGTLIDYLNKYSDITINPKAKKSYRTYDWSLNE